MKEKNALEQTAGLILIEMKIQWTWWYSEDLQNIRLGRLDQNSIKYKERIVSKKLLVVDAVCTQRFAIDCSVIV